MKKKQKIKDEYFIRVKKRILSETKDSDKKFTTTFKEIKKYTSIPMINYTKSADIKSIQDKISRFL